MLLDKKDPFRYVAWAPAALFIVAVWVGIVMDIQSVRSRNDQDEFHYPTIRKFAEELPSPDLRDYQSATTPGYHLIMAGVMRVIGEHPRALHVAGSLFSLALMMVFGSVLAGRVGGVVGAVLALPMAANMYVYSSGVWILPDNAGWLFVLLLMACLLREPFDGKTLVAGGGLALAMVMFRQSHAWIFPVFLMAAWLSATEGRKWVKPAMALLALAPALGVLAGFYWIWGGSTPPIFQKSHQHMNFASPAMILASALLPGAGFVTLLIGRLELLKSRKKWIFLCGLVGLIISVAPATAYNRPLGRYSGWWRLAMHPVVLDRSPVIILMAAGGATLIGAYLAGMTRKRDMALFGTMIGAFLIVNTAGAYAFQRYYDPLLLMIFPMMAIWGVGGAPRWEWRKMAGPMGLLAAMLGITALFLGGGG